MKKQTPFLAVFFSATLLFSLSQMAAKSMSPSPVPVGTPAGGTFQLLSLPFQTPAFLFRIGLYDGGNADITNGDLNSQDYWWTKYDAMMLDLALKEHQPEGHIGLNLAIALRRIDDLLKIYPKHEQILKWKAHFEEIQSKINPDADRGASFGAECPWDEANFAQLWVNFHWVQLLISQKEWGTAAGLMTNVRQNYEIMLKPDRMKNYPEELRKWVIDSKPEADKMGALIKDKTGN